MGYLISGLIVRSMPNAAALRDALPAASDFCIYQHPELGLFAIDIFRANRPNDWPLTTPIPATDIPLELAPHNAVVSAAYGEALAQRAANGIKRSYINLAELFSVRLEQPVFAVFADDDDADFACVA